MAFITDNSMDAALDYVINAAERQVLCSSEPANYAAVAAAALADVVVDTGDFSKAAGDTSGRKMTVAAQTGVNIDTSGTATHVAIVDDTGTELLHTTALSASQAVTSGNTADIAAYDHEIADAVQE